MFELIKYQVLLFFRYIVYIPSESRGPFLDSVRIFVGGIFVPANVLTVVR